MESGEQQKRKEERKNRMHGVIKDPELQKTVKGILRDKNQTFEQFIKENITRMGNLNMTTEKISVGQISSSHISKLITVEGRINKIWPIKAKLIVGAFKCQRCDHTTFFNQPLADELIEPFECPNDVCGRKGPFNLIHEESTWIDEQRLELQNLNEPAKQGQPSREIIVLVRGQDLIDTIPGVDSHVNITGTVRVMEKRGKSLFDRVLEANHIETKNPRDRLRFLRETVRKLQEEHGGAAPLEDILLEAELCGFKRDTVEDLLQKMKSAAEIIECSNDRFRVV